MAGVEARDRVVGHGPDHVLEVVGPVVHRCFDAPGEEQDHAGVIGECPLREQVRPPEAVHRLVGAGLRNPFEGRQRAGVQVVERGGPEGHLRGAAEGQREVLVLGRLEAPADLRIEAVHLAAGDVVGLVVGGELGVETGAELDRQLTEHPLHLLARVIGPVDVREQVGPEPPPRRAGRVARHLTGVDRDVAGVVRVAIGLHSAVLVPDGEVGHILDEAAAQGEIGHEHVRGAEQVHFLVEPQPQVLGVGQCGDVVRVGGVLEDRSRLIGELDRVAEGVVVHAGTLAGHRAAQRPERHARSAVCDDFAERSSPDPGSGICAVVFGDLAGGGRLPGAELDILFLYEGGPPDYYDALCGRFRKALRSFSRDNLLLAPAPRAAPLHRVRDFSDFREYHLHVGPEGELLQLTRARCVFATGRSDLAARFEALRREVLARARPAARCCPSWRTGLSVWPTPGSGPSTTCLAVSGTSNARPGTSN